jgi:hypothetical protein
MSVEERVRRTSDQARERNICSADPTVSGKCGFYLPCSYTNIPTSRPPRVDESEKYNAE